MKTTGSPGLARPASYVLASILLFVPPLAMAAPQSGALTWAGCGISKKAFMAEIASAYERKTGVKIELRGGGATKGIRQVSAGEVQIGGSCRNVLHTRNGISAIPEERGVRMNPVAWDALVVIVHKDNPVDNITLDQIRALYKGRLRNWKELGGPDAPIELYVRKGKISGVGYSIREMVFENFNEDFVAEHEMPSSGPLEKAIMKNPNGIGITGFSSARRRDIKMLKLEGVEPVYDRIKDGGYTLYRPLYLVTPMSPEIDPRIRAFLDFVRSEDGRKIIRAAGTVPFEDAIPTWLKMLNEDKKKMAVGR
jgi:phosphate transport system substrate-binding protein